MMHFRYTDPDWMTAGVSEKKPTSVGPRGMSTSITADHATEAATVMRIPCRARSSRLAPMFWPTKAVTALERLCTGRKARESSLEPTL